jgi:hypothetical protein
MRTYREGTKNAKTHQVVDLHVDNAAEQFLRGLVFVLRILFLPLRAFRGFVVK